MMELKFLSCIIRLELLTSEFLEALSNVIDNKWCSLALLHISRESMNHARLVKEILRVLGIEEEVSTEACRLHLGEAGSKIMEKYQSVLDRLKGGWKPSVKEIVNLLSEEFVLEKLAGEEAYVEIVSRITSLSIENELVSKLFKEISIEEEYHRKILEEVIKILSND